MADYALSRGPTGTVMFDHLKVAASRRLSPSLAQHLSFDIVPTIGDELLYELSTAVMAEKLAEDSRTFNFAWPRSRWQRYKERHPWIMKRLGCKYFRATAMVEVASWATFPESTIVVPDMGKPVIVQQVSSRQKAHRV
jgi:hypothetical protein